MGRPLDWRAVLAGIAVALVMSFAARAGLAPVPGLAATIIGIALGGFVAGKWADFSGFQHGAMVGVGWVVLSMFGIAPSPAYSENLLTDTVAVIVLDVAMLAAASLGGWIARRDPLSSSDRGRGR